MNKEINPIVNQEFIEQEDTGPQKLERKNEEVLEQTPSVLYEQLKMLIDNYLLEQFRQNIRLESKIDENKETKPETAKDYAYEEYYRLKIKLGQLTSTLFDEFITTSSSKKPLKEDKIFSLLDRAELPSKIEIGIKNTLTQIANNNQKLIEYIFSHSNDEISRKLLKFPNLTLEGQVTYRIYGPVIAVFAHNKTDFARLYWKTNDLNNDNRQEADETGGFARISDNQPIVVFNGSADRIFISTKKHELHHIYWRQIFLSQMSELEEKIITSNNLAKYFLDMWFKQLENESLSELISLTEHARKLLSHQFEYQRPAGTESSAEEYLAKTHLDNLISGDHHNYPEQDKISFLEKTKEFGLNNQEATSLYQQTVAEYRRFSEEKVNLLHELIKEVGYKNINFLQNLCSILFGEDIRRWRLVQSRLEHIGQNSEHVLVQAFRTYHPNNLNIQSFIENANTSLNNIAIPTSPKHKRIREEKISFCSWLLDRLKRDCDHYISLMGKDDMVDKISGLPDLIKAFILMEKIDNLEHSNNSIKKQMKKIQNVVNEIQSSYSV